MVPHLTTALAGPLADLEHRFLDRMPDIERWLRTQWQEHEVPFYASVDLRNAGFKLAPVDTNLFPGGFNNLNPSFLPLCVQAIQSAVERVCPDARGVLVRLAQLIGSQHIARAGDAPGDDQSPGCDQSSDLRDVSGFTEDTGGHDAEVLLTRASDSPPDQVTG